MGNWAYVMGFRSYAHLLSPTFERKFWRQKLKIIPVSHAGRRTAPVYVRRAGAAAGRELRESARFPAHSVPHHESFIGRQVVSAHSVLRFAVFDVGCWRYGER